jgi:hypothetical protein
MENNNFKRQIQEQLAGLHFRPSEKVWDGVEQQLKNEKRRRRVVLYWFLLAGLLSSGILITYFNAPSKNNITATATEKITEYSNETTAKDKATIPVNHQATSPTLSLKDITKATTTDKTNNDNNQPEKADTSVKTAEEELAASSQKNIKIKERNSITVKKPVINNTEDIAVNSLSAGKPITGSDIKIPDAVAEGNLLKEETVAVIKSTATKPVAINTTDSSIKKNTDTLTVNRVFTVKARKLKSPWKLGAVTNFGVSNIGNRFTFGINGGQENKAYDNVSGAPTSYAQSSLPNAPSVFKRGRAFSAGVQAEKKISKRFSIVTGIGYNYLSASVLTGQAFDSAINNGNGGGLFYSNVADRTAYRQGVLQSHVNQFHFINIPVYLKADLVTKNRFSAGVYGGVSVMQLVAVKALFYDTASRSYYYNKNNFNKTQLAVNAGIQFNYAFKKGIVISSGPQFMHTITPLSNINIYNNKYFRVWALQAKINLGKK